MPIRPNFFALLFGWSLLVAACARQPEVELPPPITVVITVVAPTTDNTTAPALPVTTQTVTPPASATDNPEPTATDTNPPEETTPAPPPTETPIPIPSATASPTATSTTPPTATAAPVAAPPSGPTVNRTNDVTGPIDVVNVSYALQQVASGIPYPVAITHAGDGTNRMFIASQEGRVYVYQNGAVLPQPFLDIAHLVIERGSEQGFLNLAFHPNYAQNGYFYVQYVAPDLYTIVERYTVSSTDPNRADPSSNMMLLRIQQTDGLHNGGGLAFGPFDGDLYVGTGDGGGVNDPFGYAQRLDALQGKVLRLDVNAGEPYKIPPENPFLTRADALPEIWAYGLRNPWRISFDRARGDIWIADVGQENTEEINFQEVFTGAGTNYGWSLMEGHSCYLGRACENVADLTTPLWRYWHEEGRCAVIGGYVYRGPSLPGLTGAYLFGDHCTGEVWAMRFNAAGDSFYRSLLFDSDLTLTSFGEDEAGEIYLLDLAGGVYRLTTQ